MGIQDGVRLWSRDNPTWHAFEVRAARDVPLPAKLLYAVVTEYGHYREFMPGITSAQVFAGSTPDEFDVYMLYSPQFVVVRARDVVLRVKRIPATQSNKFWRSEWENAHGRVPERTDAVRMPLNVGSWTIEALPGERSRVTYQVAVRPGGLIPDWMVRWGAARALPEVLQLVEKRAVFVSSIRGLGEKKTLR